MVEIIPRWEWRTFARKIETRIDLADFSESIVVPVDRVVSSLTLAPDGPLFGHGGTISFKPHTRLEMKAHTGLQNSLVSRPQTGRSLAPVRGIAQTN